MAKKKVKKTLQQIQSTPVIDLTTRELREEIRYLTNQANLKIFEYRQDVKSGKIKESKVGEILINQLKKSGGSGRLYHGEEIGKHLTYKTKNQLQIQLAKLRRFNDREDFTSDYYKKQEEKFNKSYETFNKNHKGNTFSKEDYKQFIDMIQDIKQVLPESIYEEITQTLSDLYKQASDEKRQNFSDIVLDVYNNTKGQGLSTEDLLDRIAERLQ